ASPGFTGPVPRTAPCGRQALQQGAAGFLGSARMALAGAAAQGVGRLAGNRPGISTRRSAMIEFYGVKDVYSESGVDLTLLRQNLQRTIEERWENNRRAVEFCRTLDDANPLTNA